MKKQNKDGSKKGYANLKSYASHIYNKHNGKAPAINKYDLKG